MLTKHGMRYKNFILQWEPAPTADGRFGAQMIVADEEGSPLVEERAPTLGIFATEEEAIDHAKEWGRKWADEHKIPR